MNYLKLISSFDECIRLNYHEDSTQVLNNNDVMFLWLNKVLLCFRYLGSGVC